MGEVCTCDSTSVKKSKQLICFQVVLWLGHDKRVMSLEGVELAISIAASYAGVQAPKSCEHLQ